MNALRSILYLFTLSLCLLAGQTIYAQIPASFDVSADTLCAGVPASFTNTTSATVPPNQYVWDFGDGDSSTYYHGYHAYSSPGVYVVTLYAYDSLGGSGWASDTLQVLGGFTVDAGADIQGCREDSVILNGSTTASPPYSVHWTSEGNVYGATSLSAIGVVDFTPRNYRLEVTNAFGCTVYDNVNVETNIDISWTVDCHPSGAEIVFSASGGTPPYEYSIDNGASWQTSPSFVLSSTTNCIIDVRDAVCHGPIDTQYVNLSSFALDVYLGPNVLECDGEMVTLQPVSGSFTSYSWSNGATTAAITVPAAGSASYSLTVTNAAGCTASDMITVEGDTDCVWPGDANYDGAADIYDIMAIGIASGAWGQKRPAADLDWEAQPAFNFATSFGSGVNHKHADTDGDSLVTAMDTLAVGLNYGMMHPKGDGTNGTSADPLLTIDLPDTLIAGNTYQATVSFGDATTTVSNFYGIAASLSYDNSLLEKVKLLPLTDWAGDPASDLLVFAKNREADGAIDMAVVRTDGNNVASGYGPVGLLQFTVKDDVVGSNNFDMSFSGVEAVSADESDIPVFAQDASSTAYDQAMVGIKDVSNSINVQLFPNPAKAIVNVHAKGLAIQLIEVYDLSGKLLISQQANAFKEQINVEGLAAGSYLLQLQTTEGKAFRQLIIQD